MKRSCAEPQLPFFVRKRASPIWEAPVFISPWDREPPARFFHGFIRYPGGAWTTYALGMPLFRKVDRQMTDFL